MQQEFLELFGEVISGDNMVQACGRDKCMDLIALADALEPGVSHGNRNNGFVNAKAMLKLKESLEEV